MEDIRRYFKARQAPKPSNSERKCVESSKSGTRKCAKISGKESLKKRPSLVIESDSDEDPLPPKKHKTKATVIDDSDEDIKAPTSIKLSQQKVVSPTRKQRETVLKKVKPITASSYFGTAPVHRSSKTLPKQETKAQIAKDDFEIHDDDDFRETLKLLDSSNVFTQLENKAPSHNTNGNGAEQKDKPGKTAVLKEEKPATQKFQTPAKKPEANKEEPAIVKTPSSSTEKKPNYYMHYLHRGGPKAPGSKEIPQGADGCLEKLTFVITGVLDSLDRDEAAELIKKYGGKVTQSVSKNTSYMIVGQDAGPSKLEKADKFGIKQLDEDGLLELIGKSACKSSVSKSPTPVKSTSTKDQPRFEKLQLTATITNATKSKHVTVHQDEKKHVTAGSHESDLSKEEDVKDKSPLSVKKSDTVANLMWVDKYRPLTTKQIIGQQGDRSNVQKLRHWLENWRRNHGSSNKQKKQGFGKWGADDGSNFKAALLSGPPGVGKTTTAQLVCKELKFTYVELNASDTRSKKHLQNDVSRMLQNKSLAASMDGGPNVDEKHCLLMDEVDGMAGNEDRGGVQELIQLIKKSKIPIICMCNDRMHPKIRSLANYCFDLRFQRPRIEQLKSAMMSVCFKESINVPPQALHEIIIGANQDVRQIINHLSLWSIKNKTLSIDEASTEAKHAKKDVKMGPFDVLKIVFSASDHKTMSIHEKSNLFFHDYSIAPLFVQENYLSVNPQKAVKNSTAHLRLVSKAADSICDGDLVEKLIRSQGHWGLLPVEAMFASVIPGDTMEGYLNQMIAFPSWLGRNSTKGKNDRFLQELHMHMKLKTSGNKTDVNLDYLHCLADAIVSPLTMRQNDGISDAVATMCEYNLMREDLDSLLDLRLWPNQENQFAKLSPQVKASFTRSFNKTSQPLSYATAITVKKSDNSVGISIDGEYNDLDEDESDVESEDISKDAMIKKKVPPKRKAADTGQPSTSKKTKAPKKGGKKSKS